MQGHKTLNAASIATLQRLRHFQGIFKAADVSGDGSLDEDEFVAAFKGQLGSDDKSLRRAFMAIDANCDGAVNWEEFSAYLLLEKTAAAATEGQLPGSKASPMFHDLVTSSTGTSAAAGGVSSGSAGHHAAISCLVHADVTGTPDRWYSAGIDGVVQVWNGKDLAHMRSYQSGLAAITAATYQPSSGLLALGSYSSSVTLMDPSTGRHAGTIPNMASTAALSLAAWPAPTAAAAPAGLNTGVAGGMGDGSSTSRSVVEVSRDFMALGDADGGVRLLQLDMDDNADKKTSDRFTPRKLWHSNNHRDWVVSVLHCPQISSVAAASLDKTVSLTDLERCIAVRVLTGHTKPVHSCTWNSMLKVVASGGADRRVLLWNPFSCRMLGTLEGHTAPVVCLASNERDMQVISASADHTIKVWDLRNQRCLQTLQLSPSASVLAGHQVPLSVMAFSGQAKLLVAGASRIQGWRLSDSTGSIRAGHKDAVSWAGYISDMQEVVSTDHAGMVCCWDVTTGHLLHSFSNTHGACRISTAALDDSCRRLITGAEDGSIKVWNVRGGALLSTLGCGPQQASGSQWGSGSGVEVTGLAVASSTDTNGQAAACIVATGWDRKVSWYADAGKRQCPLLRSFAGPDSDVLAAAAMPGVPTLATAHDNGEVWLWNLDSGAVLRKLMPPGLLGMPPTERAVEALAFMHGDFKHILVAAGADRVLRFWDCHSGHCLELNTSHTTPHGESLCAVTVPPDNNTIITSDTSGFITVWGIDSTHASLQALAAPSIQRGRPSSASLLASASRASVAVLGASRGAGFMGSRPQSAASGGSPRPFSRAPGVSGVSVSLVQHAVGVEVLASWRAHGDAVTALVWAPAPAAATALEGGTGGASAAAEALVGQAVQEQQAVLNWSLYPSTPSSSHVQQQQQQQQPQSVRLEAAEGQQQAQQLLAMMQQQQQPEHRQQQQQQQDPRLQRLAAAMEGMRAATAAADASSSGAVEEGSSIQGLILSAGLDRSMVLWSMKGARVGAFGSDTWQLQDISTWQDPSGCGCEALSSSYTGSHAPAADVLQPHHSFSRRSSSCSSDYSQLSLSPRQEAPAAAPADPAHSQGSSGTGQQQQQPQQQQHHAQHSGSPTGAQQPEANGSSYCCSPRQPSPKQTSPKQPGSKAVAFADECCKPSSSPRAAAAAAAVAAALAEAKLPAGRDGGCGDWPDSPPSSTAAAAAEGGTPGPRAGTSGFGMVSWQRQQLGPGPDNEASVDAFPGEGEEVCLAAEEDLPTSLWLPEFNRISRPATATYRQSPGLAAGRGRPSTAAAALGGGLHGRLGSHARGSVAAAGAAGNLQLRSSSVGLRIGGGVLNNGRVASADVGQKGAASRLTRPQSVGE